MRQKFELKDTPEGNFKKLEKVLPRIMNKMGTKAYGVIPASIVHSFNESVGADGLIFAGCMFAGELQKVAFRIKEITGKAAPEYTFVINSGDEEHSYKFSSKKKGHVFDIDAHLQDGDFVEVYQTNFDEVTLSGIYLSVLVQLNQKDNKVESFITDKLMGEEYEGI